MTNEQIQQEAERRYPVGGICETCSKQGFIKGAQFVLDRHAWVKVSDRLPTEEDANEEGMVEVCFPLMDGKWKKTEGLRKWDDEYFIGDEYWRTPLDNNFPKNESNG